jgi:isoamylase
VRNPNLSLPTHADSAANAAKPLHARRPTWEHAESVTVLLYSPADLVNPLLKVWLNFLHNKSGRIWHCRVPIAKMGEARYYAYSVSGQTIPQIHSFDPQKVLLDPYAKCIFFPPGFDRKLAMREGSNAGSAPLGV